MSRAFLTYAISLAGCTALAQAQPPLLHITDMETTLEDQFPGNEFLSSQCRGLNQNGDAIGEVGLDNGRQQAWIFTFEHGLVVLPTTSGHHSMQALDITDRDTNGEVIIVGGSVHGVHDYAINAALWRFSTVTGQVLETRDVGNLTGMDEGRLLAVNNNGIALGSQGENTWQGLSKYDIASDSLVEFDFPARPADMNDAGQVVGGRYLGDIDGNAAALGLPPDCTSLTLTGINEQGWLVGRSGRPYSDGNGRSLASWVRRTDSGWHVPDPGSPWDTGFAINNAGDITIGYGPGWDGGLYIADTGQEHWINSLLPDEVQFRYSVDYAYGINDNMQIAAASHHAVLLTPTGRMIIPGDVNGDVAVNHDDHCAWTADPIDLDGDGDADADDELWLIDRLAVFGFIVQDCNQNGVNDHCDITSGISNDCNQNDIPDECEPDCDSDGIPDSCESDCNGNGIPDECDIADGVSEDCNNNGIPDECDGAETIEGGVVYDPPQLLHTDVYFTDTILMTNPGTIADVDFTLKDNFRVGTTTVKLTHAGVTVTLIDRPGATQRDPNGFVNLSYDITLDDQGTGPNIQTVGEDCCNFETIESPPSYLPNEPLSAFNGLPREGEWKFEFIGGYAQTFDPKLFHWSVLVTDEAVDPGVCCGADIDGDGDADADDFFDYLDAFAADNLPVCDITGDGDCDADDFFAFLDLFAAGC